MCGTDTYLDRGQFNDIQTTATGKGCQLTDKEMLQQMSRENGKSHKLERLIQLNSREGAVEFRRYGLEQSKPIDIVRRLGWTTYHEDVETDSRNDAAEN